MIAKLPDRNATLLDLLPFANIDVIVTDLDGTLITGNEDVSDRIKENINILRRKKVYITIATGRTFN
jgi:hydroxymethylpyrimidine pyrophosphatase-like HAD family hydrolase